LNCDPPGGTNCAWTDAASAAISATAGAPAIRTQAVMSIRFMQAYVVIDFENRK
jgi:hypothetical protein